MLTIYRDTEHRGTQERPQYVMFLRYNMMPALECWLDGVTDEEALGEARRRFPGYEFKMSDSEDRQ